jgi:hypothetical protein
LDNFFDDFFKVVIDSRWVIVGTIGVAFLSYYFGRRNNRSARHAAAAQTFRPAIRAAIDSIPLSDAHWNSDVISKFPVLCRDINRAVSEFNHFLPWYRRHSFCHVWQELKHHCDEEIPKALSAAEKIYGGGPAATALAKENFHVHVNKLLSYATYT